MDTDKIKEAKKWLAEIDKTVKQFDPAIRASAFELLAPLYFGASLNHGQTNSNSRKADHGDSDDKGAFFVAHGDGEPHQNVLLIAAWLYSQFGKTPITRAHIDAEAAETGLTVPDRPDVTMRAAKHDGKNLFRQRGKGWELTVSGEVRVKELFGVRRGNQHLPSSNGASDE